MTTQTLNITHEGGPSNTNDASSGEGPVLIPSVRSIFGRESMDGEAYRGSARFGSSTTPTDAESFVYQDGKVLANLGPRLYQFASSTPAYGLSGIISGFIILSGSQAHLDSVIIKIRGYVTTSHSPLGSSSEVIKHCILAIHTPFYPPPPGGQFQMDERVPFSITIPIEVTYPQIRDTSSGSTGAITFLPPSYRAVLRTMTCDVSYFLEIEVKKKGLRRNATIRIPFYYLPKTSLMQSVPQELSLPFPLHISDISSVGTGIKIVQSRISTKDSSVARASANDSNEVDIYMSLPSSYVASGSRIPLLIDISSSKVPKMKMATTVSELIHIEMRRNITIWHGRSGRKAIDVHHSHVISTAKRTGVFGDVDSGYMRLEFSLQAGIEGKECSWAVDGLVSVQYSIRVSLQDDTNEETRPPQITHDEPIQITTDNYGVVERQLASTGGLSLPALGLLVK